ncbi:hypothetical protein ACRAWD_23080 [Caulobacter segnis]
MGDVTLKQDIGARSNVYVTYSRGYKPKVYNLDATVTPTNTFNPVNKEQVDNFEGGLKGDYFRPPRSASPSRPSTPPTRTSRFRRSTRPPPCRPSGADQRRQGQHARRRAGHHDPPDPQSDAERLPGLCRRQVRQVRRRELLCARPPPPAAPP